MDSHNPKFNVLVVGATGKLGSYITKHLLTKPNITTHIMVRNPQKNKELTQQVEKAGGKVIIADVTKHETLKRTTKGIHTVVSALFSLEAEVLVGGQMALIDDCVENGVERFIPAEFSDNFEKFTEEELSHVSTIQFRLKIREYLASKPIKTLRIDGTIFTESFYDWIMPNGFGYWGDFNHKYQTTTYEDTARFTAAAIANKDQVGHLVFVANEMTVAEAAEIYNKVRGTNFPVKKLGSLEDLRKKAEELEKNKDPKAWNFWFHHLIFDERSRFDKVNNDEFPEVKGLTTVEELLRQKPEIVISNEI